MDGERKEDIITTSIKSPTGLAIDFPNQKLLWSDSKLHQIASSDLDGGNRRRIEVYDVRHPVDVAVFGDFIYWSDSVSKTVSSANKFTGKNVTVIVNREDVASFIPKGISIHHALSQPQGTFIAYVFHKLRYNIIDLFEKEQEACCELR